MLNPNQNSNPSSENTPRSRNRPAPSSENPHHHQIRPGRSRRIRFQDQSDLPDNPSDPQIRRLTGSNSDPPESSSRAAQLKNDPILPESSSQPQSRRNNTSQLPSDSSSRAAQLKTDPLLPESSSQLQSRRKNTSQLSPGSSSRALLKTDPLPESSSQAQSRRKNTSQLVPGSSSATQLNADSRLPESSSESQSYRRSPHPQPENCLETLPHPPGYSSRNHISTNFGTPENPHPEANSPKTQSLRPSLRPPRPLLLPPPPPPTRNCVQKENQLPSRHLPLPPPPSRQSPLLPPPRKTNPIVWCCAALCFVFAVLLFLGAISTLIVFLVVKPHFPSIDISAASLSLIYVDSPDLLNGNLAVTVNFSNPNDKLEFDFTRGQVNTYIDSVLIATHMLEPFRIGHAAWRTQSVQLVTSQVALGLDRAKRIRSQAGGGKVNFDLTLTLAVKASLGAVSFPLGLHSRCGLVLSSPPNGVLLSRKCSIRR